MYKIKLIILSATNNSNNILSKILSKIINYNDITTLCISNYYKSKDDFF